MGVPELEVAARPAELLFVILLLAFSVLGCGARTLLDESVDSSVSERMTGDELCDGLDQDLDGAVDEDFRDALGRYVHPRHCGACGVECVVPDTATLEMDCLLVDENPVCGATLCVPGFWPSRSGRCVPAYDHLCLPCTQDTDCGLGALASCADVGGERRCAVACEVGCPSGYACQADGVCAPAGGSCSCEPSDSFELACVVDTTDEDAPGGPAGIPLPDPLPEPDMPACPGRATCLAGVLSECVAPVESCNERDDDCDGEVDEDFRNAVGGYSDLHHCGQCGVDCALSPVPEGDLVCGGDPFAPACVLSCPDTLDGVQPGDRVDGDRDIATGCECTVTSLDDAPGPVGAVGQDLDVNCDGADGEVTLSVYVAPDGDDAGPGSPTRPMATVTAAIERAMEAGRPDVFIASGTYVEALTLPSGVRLHGGYRRDFLALDPAGFTTVLRAPLDSPLPGGAALMSTDCTPGDTVIEWLSVRGRDAVEPSSASVAIWLGCLSGGRTLRLDTIDVRPGVPGAGRDGTAGMPGASPATLPLEGAPPRGALESGRQCTSGPANTVAGGAGGQHVCAGQSTAGGAGASAGCPFFANFQPQGDRGQGRAPGRGGDGGQDSRGPVTGSSCPRPVCCGLADFQVPSMFTGPRPGDAGADGTAGSRGAGCADALGRFAGTTWTPGTSTSGSAGTAASGGGGGGAGGGAEMDFIPNACEFADGLGGGGGGGGAGGCGGGAGSAGTSGGPAIAVYVDDSSAPGLVVQGSRLTAPDGGRGGDGGAGGGGGAGSPGAPGGFIPLAERITPTLAGPFPGERGGSGGRGGDGGGGGGGCGGASLGVWGGSAADASRWRALNTFDVGMAGRAGRGGGGAAQGGDGIQGGSFDVLSR
ncbi:MAG: hypothetical protein R3B40_08870 [Polyangiales bacterium]|nr:hypothetical protein [Sandaracinaceae bacterium]